MPEPAQPTPRRGPRFDPRWVVLAVALVLAMAPPDPPWMALLVPALSPLTALASAVATRAVTLVAAPGLPLLLLAIARPRWICRFACPLGPALDACGRLRRGGAGRIPAGAGRMLLGAILGAAAVGSPFLLWLDPFALVNAAGRMARHPADLATAAAGLGVLIPVLFAIGFPRAWCGRVCPLGAMQDILAGLRRSARAEPASGATGAAYPPLSRREFLGAGAGVAAAVATRASGGTVPGPLRPPGAVRGPCFGAVCVRCGNCAAACPSRIIRPDPGRHGVASFLSPVLEFSKDYCREDCRRCTEVCPSGALAPLRTPGEKKAWLIGRAKVDLGTCLLAAGRECTQCVTACPHGAISVRSDGFDSAPAIDPALCNGCGACEAVCPVEPVRSILVMAEEGGPVAGAREG